MRNTLAPHPGSIIIERGIADSLVASLARFGVVAEVMPDGRYFRVISHRLGCRILTGVCTCGALVPVETHGV
jgi:hypothetical protein